jgi:hypothetical protein
LFGSGQASPKSIASISSHSSQAKTDFLHLKTFQSGQNHSSSIPSHFSQTKTNFCNSNLFQSGKNRLPPFQAIPVRPKAVSSIPLYSSQAPMGFFPTSHIRMANIVDHSKLFPTSSIPRHSSPAKTDLLNSKPFQLGQNRLLPFQSGQNRLPPFQAITVQPKAVFSIPLHFSQAKMGFLDSKPFQSGQNRPPPFQAISVRPKPTFAILVGQKPTFAILVRPRPTSSIPCYSSQAKTDFFHSKLSQSDQNRLPPF